MEKINKNKFYKTNPRGGISLIVLVITIIVIIILAAAVIISLINNNPISEANRARYESDVANMQAVFTNTVAKVMAKNQGTVSIEAVSLNSVKSGVNKAQGQVRYRVDNPVDNNNAEGVIIFGIGEDNDTTYYTGKELPIYASGETIWYVDSDGLISVEVGGVIYGEQTDKPQVELKEEIEIVESTNPMLQRWTSGSKTDFHNEEYRDKITKARFMVADKVPENRVEAWDVSQSKDKSVMAWVEDDGNDSYILTIAGKSGIIPNSNSGFLFESIKNLKEIENFDIFNTSNVKTMGGMFLGCSSLKTLNVSNFDTSNVITMNKMFFGCSSLTELDLSNFDTGKVKSMEHMFYDCVNLKNLVFSNKFSTANLENFTNIFGNCYNLTTEITILHNEGVSSQNVSSAFDNAATISPAQITLNYASNTERMVDTIISKNSKSNIVKGVQID